MEFKLFKRAIALFSAQPTDESDAALKAEQLGLMFELPATVKPYTRRDGTFIPGHQSTRRHSMKPAEQPTGHPLQKVDATPGAIISWMVRGKPVSARVITAPDVNGFLTATITAAPPTGKAKVGATATKHIDQVTVVIAGQPKVPETRELDFGSEAPRPSEIAPAVGASGPALSEEFGAPYDATPAQRRADNAAALDLLKRKTNEEMTEEDKRILERYSGRGGIGDSLNEYYTRPDVARAMWGVIGRLGGLPGTNFLEPSCGTGVFLHTAPGGIDVTGNEMDPTSCRIATILHTGREIAEGPFESLASTDGRLWDGVIGNPPFGPRGALIGLDKKDITRAEQYFLDTALDKTNAGGLVSLVLPIGVMDASSATSFRRDLLCKGQFLGAMRMPNTAFKHSQTEVTTDVVFFRRRPPDVAQALLTVGPEALQELGVLDEEFVNGLYFEGRGAPNVLGTPEEGWRAKAGIGNDITVSGSMSGVADAIAAFEPEQPRNVTLQEIIAALAPDDIAQSRAERAALKAPYPVAKLGDVKQIDGQYYRLEGQPPRWHLIEAEESGEPAHVASARQIGERIGRFAHGEPGLGAGELMNEMKAWIDQHGNPRNDAELKRAAKGDQALHRLLAAVDENGQFSDLLTGRAKPQPASLEAVAERLSLLHGGFSADEAADQTRQDVELVLDQLHASDQYALDRGRWVSMSQYLTGNLWLKLDAIDEALKEDVAPADGSKLKWQRAKLEEAIAPKSLEDVEFALNSGWVPIDTIAAYYNDKRAAYLAENPSAKSWYEPFSISFEKSIYHIKGGEHETGLLEKYLNRTGVRKDDLPAIEVMNREFRQWVLASDLRTGLEDLYNRKFRGFVQERFSEQPMEVPGLDPAKASMVNAYHWPSVRWALQEGKGIVAADVGLGKTLRTLMLNQLLRATGQAKKPMIPVPKSVLANWVKTIEAWFPGAKYMVIGESYSRGKDGELKGKEDSEAIRNRKYHELAQNDYDFVLISMPAWNDLDLSPAKKKEYSDGEFWAQRADQLGQASDKRRRKLKEAFDQSMAKRDFEKRSDVIFFEDLGVDALLCDEAHAYKNLFAARDRFGESPKFLGGTGQSNRALDMLFKSSYIREKTGGKNVYFMTATPSKNSPLEIYSMLSHVAPEAFNAIGIRNSEEFLDRYCVFKQGTFLGVDGTLQEGLINSGFKNLDELREIMKRYINRQTAQEVGLKLPAPEEVEHLVDMNASQKAVYEQLREMAETGTKDDGTDAHIFSIMSKMDKASLDLAILDPVRFAGAKSPKYDDFVKTAVKNKADGGQIVFCDHIDAHEKLKKRLVDKGFEPDRVAIINAQAASSSLARQKIADAFNAGKVDVVIGNTDTMGEGLDLQKKTSDIHDLDIPWNPAILRQRHGRGVRQGNTNENIRLHRYLARGSFDGYRYQTVLSKQDWMDQLWSGADRIDNAAAKTLGREDLLIMLSADPEAARKKMEENVASQTARIAARKRAQAGEDYARYSELFRSYGALKNKGTASANRLKQRMDATRARLEDDPHFEAKDALTNPDDVAVDPITGQAWRPNTAMRVTIKDHAPFNWADGTHRFVVTHVYPRNGVVALRPYGMPGDAVRVSVGALSNRAESIDFDPEAEQTEAATHTLGGIAPEMASQFGVDSEKLSRVVNSTAAKVIAGNKDWHKAPESRGRMLAQISHALQEELAPHITDKETTATSMARLMDGFELELALQSGGKHPSKIKQAKDLVGTPESAIMANQDLIQRWLKGRMLAYQDGHSGDVPMVGPAGDAQMVESFNARKMLESGRFMLPTEADKALAIEGWKKEQRGRQLSRKEAPKSHNSYTTHFMPGVQARYGGQFTGEKTNKFQHLASLFGNGFVAEAEQQLRDECRQVAGAQTGFTHKVAAWLPAVKVPEFGGGPISWEPEVLRDLYAAAKAEGILERPIGDHKPATVPSQIFDGAEAHAQSNYGHMTTVAAALAAAAKTKDSELAKELATYKQFIPQSAGYR